MRPWPRGTRRAHGCGCCRRARDPSKSGRPRRPCAVAAVLAELETSAALYEVRAPRAGWIEALPYKLGERPPAGAPVVVMLAEGTRTRESTCPSRSAPA
jgi:hypothetical protein